MFDIFLWSLTTLIAIFALYTSEWAAVHRRLLPWTGGVLVGVSLFWIIPDVVEGEGWSIAVGGILAGIVVLAMVDRYVYPICPFCALGTHQQCVRNPAGSTSARHLQVGWPVLAAGCIHNFFDGWLVALPQADTRAAISNALSLGFTAHKIPESFAVGLLAGALTSTRRRGLGVVLLVQMSFALGILAVLSAKGMDYRVADACLAVAGATLMFFGLTTLQTEWRNRGAIPALKAGIFGIFGCGLAALAFRLIY